MLRSPSISRPRGAVAPARTTIEALEDRLGVFLARYSVPALRITLGAIFLGFGVLKFFPGVSPAQNIAVTTMSRLTLGIIPPDVSIYIVAGLECAIGILLISGKLMRLTFVLLAFQFVGILSPLVLLTGRLFAGPDGAPTLEGQYVIKDFVLLAAVLVIAADYFTRRTREREAAHNASGPLVQTE